MAYIQGVLLCEDILIWVILYHSRNDIRIVLSDGTSSAWFLHLEINVNSSLVPVVADYSYLNMHVTVS